MKSPRYTTRVTTPRGFVIWNDNWLGDRSIWRQPPRAKRPSPRLAPSWIFSQTRIRWAGFGS